MSSFRPALTEREWAVGEIRRLRSDLGRLSRNRDAVRNEKDMERVGGIDPALSAERLLRLTEVSTVVGLKHSAIYKCVSALLSGSRVC
jgi:Prophage CP4-57 regulatory protein (AlpA)